MNESINESTVRYHVEDNGKLVDITWDPPKSAFIKNVKYRLHFTNKNDFDDKIIDNPLLSLSSSLLPIKFTVITVYIDGDKQYESRPSDEIHITGPPKIERISKSLFEPKFPARAHLNIFTAKELTKNLLNEIEEYFE
eukprot:230632_1